MQILQSNSTVQMLYYTLRLIPSIRDNNYICLVMQVLDYLAIGVHELASMSERRQERLMNPGVFAYHVE